MKVFYVERFLYKIVVLIHTISTHAQVNKLTTFLQKSSLQLTLVSLITRWGFLYLSTAFLGSEPLSLKVYWSETHIKRNPPQLKTIVLGKHTCFGYEGETGQERN